MKALSIIIITYNRPHDLLELLTDITKINQKDLLEDVIILNNNSTDSYEKIKQFVNEHQEINFNLIESEENLGVSKGRNYATRVAKGEVFFYMDDDTNFEDKDLLRKIIDSFNSSFYQNRKLGVVSFKVLYSADMQMQKNAFPHKKFELYKNKQDFPTYYYAGCAHAILKEAWLKAGEYPENFFYGMEEYDFAYRVMNAGYFIKYDDSVIIIHKESQLGRKPKEEKVRMMWVNKTKVAWKYLPKKYFYTTAFLWSVQYLKNTNFNLAGFLKGWKKIFKITSTEKRIPIDKSSLNYLKKVDARLWY